MLKLVLLISLSILASGIPQAIESKRTFSNVQIAGGDFTRIQDHPYQLSLLYGLMHVCGGVIIDAKWAVTAASCTENREYPLDFQVRVSSSWIQDGNLAVVKKIYPHPKYNNQTFDFDISVLEFEDPFKFDNTAAPIGLVPSNYEPSEGTQGTVSGWGYTDINDDFFSGLLKAITLPIISRESCNKTYGGKITKNMICAGFKDSGDGFCEGDNGGPLVIDGKLAGIVSWQKSCNNPAYPGVYSNLGTLGDFVREVTGLPL